MINGEKWFVTANLADFFFLQAKIEGKGDALFFVNIDSDGVSMIENPLFSHTFLHHPTYQFKNVFVADKDVIGGGNSGMDYSKLPWTREINHCCENVRCRKDD